MIIGCPYLQVVAQLPRPQAEIAADLRSPDIETLDEAIVDANRIPSNQRTPILEKAILYALEAEYHRDEEARRAGTYRFYDEPLRYFLSDLAIEMGIM